MAETFQVHLFTQNLSQLKRLHIQYLQGLKTIHVCCYC